MNAGRVKHSAAKDPSVGAIPEIEVAGVTLIVCLLIIAVCFAAALLLELPQVMEVGTEARLNGRKAAAAAAAQTEDARRSPAHFLKVDDALATWRLRESD